MQYFPVAALSGFLVLCSAGASGLGESDDQVTWQHGQRSCKFHVLMQRGVQLPDNFDPLGKTKEGKTSGAPAEKGNNAAKPFTSIKVAPNEQGSTSAVPAEEGNMSAKVPMDEANSLTAPAEEGNALAKASMSTKIAPSEHGNTSVAPVAEGNSSAKASMSRSADPMGQANHLNASAEEGNASAFAPMSTKTAPIEYGNTSATPAADRTNSAKSSILSSVAPMEEGNSNVAAIEKGKILTAPDERSKISAKRSKSKLKKAMLMIVSMAIFMACFGAIATVIPIWVIWCAPEPQQEIRRHRRVRFAIG